MAVNPNIRDQAYKFFIEEAPELLQAIEAGLLNLKQERSHRHLHDLMRTAHSLKGGAAGIGLEAIATLAHRLENIFKALYNETVEIDTDLESKLLRAYDCLCLPLMQEISTGQFSPEQALASAEPVFAQVEERLVDALAQVENYDIPDSAELGVDMTLSLFEVDVGQGLEHLRAVVANPQDYQVATELCTQAEVFAELAEILNKPGLGAIAEVALAALKSNSQQALQITQLALADFQAYREGVLAGSSEEVSPSAALLALAQEESREFSPEQEHLDQIFSDDTLCQLNQQEDSGFEEQQLPLDPPQDEITYTTVSFHSDQETFSISGTISEQDLTQPELPVIIEGEFAEEDISVSEEVEAEASSLEDVLEDVFGNALAASETEASSNSLFQITSTLQELQQPHVDATEPVEAPFNLISTPESVEAFNSTPDIEEVSTSSSELLPLRREPKQFSSQINPQEIPTAPRVTVRVDSDRLERMNNLADEAAINRSGLFLQNKQLQGAVRDLLTRVVAIEQVAVQLRKVSDQTLVPDFKNSYGSQPDSVVQLGELATSQADFDSLEMDNYGALHSLLQRFLEDMVQLRESVDDIALFASNSGGNLEQLRKMLTQLQDEFMWARMLPLGEVLKHFPRVLRDLSTKYHKPVNLKLSGTGVLVDKAVLEKIYDPLLHLLRNAFDHGIEFPEIRRQVGKTEQGQIEIKAYYRGGQTIIEISDDGQGLNTERIACRAMELGWLSTEEMANVPDNQLFNLIFEPGFSTAQQVDQLSGRGVGLDVVRTQLQTLKGTITVGSQSGVGTTFTLRLPLTLTSAKLIIGLVGTTAIALPSDSIEEIVVPKAEQVKKTGTQQFLYWRGKIAMIYRLCDLLEYACPVPENPPNEALKVETSATEVAPPLLIIDRGQQVFALEIDRLVTEQKLVIKPFGTVMASPSYTYGCTILGDGNLIPVIDGATLLDLWLDQNGANRAIATVSEPEFEIDIGSNHIISAHQDSSVHQNTAALKGSTSLGLIGPGKTSRTIDLVKTATKVLIVDDAVSLRRTLALTLERAGYRVLQAGDGWEAIKQLQRSPDVGLVICDIEMPNMNGFDFLNHRRQDPQIQNIPVMMLTSRSNDKHRRLAMHLGANAYLTKPYIEQEFLKVIKDIVGQSTPLRIT
ncbi:MAG: response regulator [Symploca sp. SIO1C4]|uniref:histidine kinase n=1 Tax=Symploca sp. SIO1C4 TaxID=2607765 RepID=A0A6B3NBN1_9CYAN|nr:response regulator [Symploca sp. SIO1C4]